MIATHCDHVIFENSVMPLDLVNALAQHHIECSMEWKGGPTDEIKVMIFRKLP